MRFQRKTTNLQPNVALIPLIDVIFQLVAFFIVTSTFIMAPGISINLPTSETSEPIFMTQLVVTVVSRDEIYLNKERYDLEGLDLELSTLPDVERDKIKSVIIEGDSNVSYNLMIGVLDVLRKNGFKAVSLRTREKEVES